MKMFQNGKRETVLGRVRLAGNHDAEGGWFGYRYPPAGPPHWQYKTLTNVPPFV